MCLTGMIDSMCYVVDLNNLLDVTTVLLLKRIQSLLPWLNGELHVSTDRERSAAPEITSDDAASSMNVESDFLLNKTTVEPA